jgi:hypothetical protein
VIRLIHVEVLGHSDAGPFAGALSFTGQLQIVSAHNSYGKSLAARAIGWCLGLEALFGMPPNDNAFFPLAVREDIDFEARAGVSVLSSEAVLTLSHEDGRYLRLTRAIRGDATTVGVEEIDADGTCRESKLNARKDAMQDATGGLQHLLFEWIGLPRADVATFRGTSVDVYLENLSALFYIEQDEGWTDIQARQITRYQQQQIAQVAVEYLLGATDAVAARVAQQNAYRREAELRATARSLADHITSLFARHGWPVTWPGGGSVADIMKRWRTVSLKDALLAGANVDFGAERVSLTQHAAALRRALTSDPIDPMNASAHAEASQRVIDLKQRRHALSDELRTIRLQQSQTSDLQESLEHRIHGAQDVLRLKTSGVGRLESMECPTCHRDLEPETFHLTEQTASAVSAHIEAIKRDRDLVRRNVEALTQRIVGLQAELARTDDDFRSAERALATVTAAVGTVREQLAGTAANLSATERRLDRLAETESDVDELQREIQAWLDEAAGIELVPFETADLQRRLGAFTDALRQYLLALGHSAVTGDTAALVRLDDQYRPLLGTRHLLSLGSASDRPRVIAAYSLALAAASGVVGGLHPGFVILDEPLQQNPDEQHRDLFLNFLSQDLALNAAFQIIVLTSLRTDEVERLRTSGVRVDLPVGKYFLKLGAAEELPNAGPAAEKTQKQPDAD